MERERENENQIEKIVKEFRRNHFTNAKCRLLRGKN